MLPIPYNIMIITVLSSFDLTLFSMGCVTSSDVDAKCFVCAKKENTVLFCSYSCKLSICVDCIKSKFNNINSRNLSNCESLSCPRCYKFANSKILQKYYSHYKSMTKYSQIHFVNYRDYIGQCVHCELFKHFSPNSPNFIDIQTIFPDLIVKQPFVCTLCIDSHYSQNMECDVQYHFNDFRDIRYCEVNNELFTCSEFLSKSTKKNLWKMLYILHRTKFNLELKIMQNRKSKSSEDTQSLKHISQYLSFLSQTIKDHMKKHEDHMKKHKEKEIQNLRQTQINQKSDFFHFEHETRIEIEFQESQSLIFVIHPHYKSIKELRYEQFEKYEKVKKDRKIQNYYDMQKECDANEYPTWVRSKHEIWKRLPEPKRNFELWLVDYWNEWLDVCALYLRWNEKFRYSFTNLTDEEKAKEKAKESFQNWAKRKNFL